MRRMQRFRTRKALVVCAAALVVAVASGAAIAASGSSSPSPQSFFDSVAKHLGISSQKLQDATKAAEIDQVNAALADGKITKAEADQLKARINSGQYPPFFGPGFGGRHEFHRGPGMHLFGDKLSAAAGYLGLTQDQLRTKLMNGQSLAGVAKAQGKSVDGLKQTILDGAKKRLDQAVKDGDLTQAQANDMLDRLKAHVDELVNGDFPRGRDHERFEHGPGALWAPSA
jgi:hypothetical protein